MTGVETALIIGGITAAASAAAANQQRQQAQKNASNAARSANIRVAQLGDSASLERKKAARDAARIRGIISVNAAERGVGVGGSVEALLRQAELDEANNANTVDTNLSNESLNIRSEYTALESRLRGSAPNPFFAGFQGGLSGAATGLSLGGSGGGTTEVTQGQFDGAVDAIEGGAYGPI